MSLIPLALRLSGKAEASLVPDAPRNLLLVESRYPQAYFAAVNASLRLFLSLPARHPLRPA